MARVLKDLLHLMGPIMEFQARLLHLERIAEFSDRALELPVLVSNS
jgi:hypothetical protein